MRRRRAASRKNPCGGREGASYDPGQPDIRLQICHSKTRGECHSNALAPQIL
jgi:hypothetical protein